MNLFLILLIILACIILAILILGLFISYKLKKNLGEAKVSQLFGAIRNYDSIVKEELKRKKNVVGMTKLVMPRVLEDFNDFDFQILSNKIESDLTDILKSIQNKQHIDSQDLNLVKDVVNKKIDDLIQSGKSLKYNDIVFHKHALKSYTRQNGLATITTSTTLEYLYSDGKKNKYSDIKRQTRYTCQYVYIYDYSKIKNISKQRLFILNCPNCGAPLYDFLDGRCKYCMSKVGQEKLKVWRISSYKEDYQN